MTRMAVPLPAREAYSSFCSVDVRHQFCAHSDQAFAGLSFSPGPRTAVRLHEWGMLFRPRADGFDLICDSGRWNALEALLAAIAARATGGLPPGLADSLLGPPLLFFASLADSLFLNFTDVPADHAIGAPVLWLSNRDASPGDGPDSYRLRVDWTKVGDEPAGSAAPPPATQPPAPSPSGLLASEFGIDPGPWSATGRDQLLGAEEAASLLRPATVPHFAVLAIYPSGAGEGAEPVRSGPGGSSARKVRYLLSFAARSSYWRYIVASRKGSIDGENYAIVDNGTGERAAFDPGAAVTLPDGRTAISFVSAEPRLTARQPTADLGLQRRSDTLPRRQMVIPRLPAPGPDTPVARGEAGQFRSDIYVFV